MEDDDVPPPPATDADDEFFYRTLAKGGAGAMSMMGDTLPEDEYDDAVGPSLALHIPALKLDAFSAPNSPSASDAELKSKIAALEAINLELMADMSSVKQLCGSLQARLEMSKEKQSKGVQEMKANSDTIRLKVSNLTRAAGNLQNSIAVLNEKLAKSKRNTAEYKAMTAELERLQSELETAEHERAEKEQAFKVEQAKMQMAVDYLKTRQQVMADAMASLASSLEKMEQRCLDMAAGDVDAESAAQDMSDASRALADAFVIPAVPKRHAGTNTEMPYPPPMPPEDAVPH